VREQAMTTLVEIYRHVGERFRADISRKDINTAKYVAINTVHISVMKDMLFCSVCEVKLYKKT